MSSIRAHSTRWPAIAATAALVAAAFWVPPATAAVSPCTSSGIAPAVTYTCTSGAGTPVAVPAGADFVEIVVTGGGGGASYDDSGPALRVTSRGGAGAVVAGAYEPAAAWGAAAQFTVTVGAGGGAGGAGTGAAGGGASVVSSPAGELLAVAGGGGGGGIGSGDGFAAGAGAEAMTAAGQVTVGGGGAAGSVDGGGGGGTALTPGTGGPGGTGALPGIPGTAWSSGGAGGFAPGNAGSGGSGYGGGGSGALDMASGAGGAGGSFASTLLTGTAIWAASGAAGDPGTGGGTAATAPADMTGARGEVILVFGADDPGVPGAPAIVSAVAGDESAVVTWSPPGSDGGEPIDAYDYSTDDGTSWQGFLPDPVPANPFTITGLTNGQQYCVRIRAVNSVSPGEPSQRRCVTPAAAPSAPLDVRAAAQDGQAEVSFKAPASDGGSPITDYEYQVDGGPWVQTGRTSSPITVPGLDNGKQYSIRVRAVNARGSGEPSAPVQATPAPPVPPAGVPGAPTVSVAAGDRVVQVTFVPGSDGGSPITKYQVSLNGGSVWRDTSPAIPTSPFVIRVASNSVPVSVSLRAVNSVGAGVANPAQTVVPTPVPWPPRDLMAEPMGRAALSTFRRPDEGVPITSYEYQIDGGAWVGIGLSTSQVVHGLELGRQYSFRVRAVNRTGAGLPSAPVLVVPGAPGRPAITEVEAGDRQLRVRFVPGDVYLGAVDEYQVTAQPGGVLCATRGRSCVLDGLDNGTEYAVTVVAFNDLGPSNASEPGFGVPRGPVIGSPLPESGQEQPPGQVLVTVSGTPEQVTQTTNPSQGSTGLRGGAWSVDLRPESAGGGANVLLGGTLQARAGGGIGTSGGGFLGGSQVGVTVYSKAIPLRRLRVDARGRFAGRVRLPARLAAGAHTVQLVGFGRDGRQRSINLGITVHTAAATLSPVRGRSRLKLQVFPKCRARYDFALQVRRQVAWFPGHGWAAAAPMDPPQRPRWVTIGRSRTKGATQQRVLNLPRGTYRAKVAKGCGNPAVTTNTVRIPR